MSDMNAAVRAYLEDFAENALDSQAVAAASVAALDLHQPFTKSGMVHCKECSPTRDEYKGGTSLRHYVLTPWPCATWKAIVAAVLGEEVADLEYKRIRELEC